MPRCLRRRSKQRWSWRERAEAEQVDLEQPEVFDVVLVPLDDGAARHRGVLDRHDVVDRLVTEQKAAGVDREVARELEDLVGRAAAGARCRPRDRIEPARAQRFGVERAVGREKLGDAIERGLGNARAPCRRRARAERGR